MNTNPSIDDLLEGVIVAISTEIVPSLADAKAHASAAMIQSLLQSIRQILPVRDAYLVEEHDEMIATLANMCTELSEVEHDAAIRLRERLGQYSDHPELPAPLPYETIAAQHHELSTALEGSLYELDEMQRAGITEADVALNHVRAHLGPRFVRDAATITIEGGMVGRG